MKNKKKSNVFEESLKNTFNKQVKLDKAINEHKEGELSKSHIQELYEASVRELNFEKISSNYLFCVLEEIETITNDVLVKEIVNNAIARHEIDKMCHARTIFEDSV